MPETVSVTRPQRWDHPFSFDLNPSSPVTDSMIDEWLTRPPFNQMDETGFRKSMSLRDLLKNDARLMSYQSGDIIVRRGDWGNSAFFILNGSVRAEVESADSSIPPSMLGRQPTRKRTLFESIAQLWKTASAPESRSRFTPNDSRIGSRGQGGQTRVFLQDLPAVLRGYRTETIPPGQWFGELSALGRTPRTATVFAEGPAQLLELRWQGLRDLMRFDRNNAIRTDVETSFREHALEEFLRNHPVFQGLSDEKLKVLMDHAEFRTFGEYDSPKPFKELAKQGFEDNFESEALILEEGHYPNDVFFVRSGLARLTVKHHHGHRTVGYLTPGHAYGFHEVAASSAGESVPYQCSVRAISFLSGLLIPTPVVESVLLETDENRQSTSVLPIVPVPTIKGDAVPEPLLEFLVEERFVQATAAMVIDLDRCVRCDDCVRACATAHDGNPRFVRHGPIHGHHMLANACLHCVDPVCMVECPTGAIHREFASGNVVISESSCIGCAQCANNCPYDAIRMVQITDQNGQLIVDDRNGRPLTQATKCDLCLDQLGGPACQNACAHDALRRVDLSDVQQLQEVFAR
ncbi:MAG: cyclic nucleotide-binding domain-containing protein [Planctomycetaceae bacterium]